MAVKLVGMISTRDNVRTEMDGTVLVLRIETDEEKVNARPSGTGKTMVIATTGKAAIIDLRDGRLASLNLTLYWKP